MLIIEAAGFDEAELQEMICDRCSELGVVMDIEIRKIAALYRYEVATVEMSSEEEANEVVRQLGGKDYGSSVVIRILHKGKLIAEPRALH